MIASNEKIFTIQEKREIERRLALQDNVLDITDHERQLLLYCIEKIKAGEVARPHDTGYEIELTPRNFSEVFNGADYQSVKETARKLFRRDLLLGDIKNPYKWERYIGSIGDIEEEKRLFIGINDNALPYIDEVERVCNLYNNDPFLKGTNFLRKVPKSEKKRDRRTQKKEMTAAEFIEAAEIKYPGIFDYSQTEYKTLNTEVLIECKKHGFFKVRPSTHLKENKCPVCNPVISSGGASLADFKILCDKHNNGLGILYILECEDLNQAQFIKIGITSRSVKARYGGNSLIPYKYNVIEEITAPAAVVYTLEKTLLKRNVKNRYYPLLKFAGETECFNGMTSEVKEIIAGYKELSEN